MDWSGVIGLVTAAAAVIASAWAIVSDRSKVRLLERIVQVSQSTPEDSSARQNLDELRDRAASDLLDAYKGGKHNSLIGWGLVLSLAATGGLALTFVVPGPSAARFFSDDWKPFVVVGATIVFVIGYLLVLLGLRKRMRARRQAAWEAESKEREERMKKRRKQMVADARRYRSQRWWSPLARRNLRQLLAHIDDEEADRGAYGPHSASAVRSLPVPFRRI